MVPTASGAFVERDLSELSGADDVLLLQLEGDLFFGVADELADRLAGLVEAPVKAVVVRLKRTHVIDATVMTVLERFIHDMHERARFVVLCGLQPRMLASLEAFGLVEQLGADNLFETSQGIFESTTRALARANTLIGNATDQAPREPVVSDDEGTDWAYDN